MELNISNRPIRVHPVGIRLTTPTGDKQKGMSYPRTWLGRIAVMDRSTLTVSVMRWRELSVEKVS